MSPLAVFVDLFGHFFALLALDILFAGLFGLGRRRMPPQPILPACGPFAGLVRHSNIFPRHPRSADLDLGWRPCGNADLPPIAAALSMSKLNTRRRYMYSSRARMFHDPRCLSGWRGGEQ